MESKKDIRKSVLELRKHMPQEEWEEKSHNIYEKLVAHPFFLDSEEIYCYIDYRNEVATKKIIETAWSANKKVAVPKISNDDMEFYYINHFEELTSGYCRILEPTSQTIANGNRVLVIMPGAVFDHHRNRIGYGKGFYDRYLSKYPEFHTIALGFELQCVEEIPCESHDIRPEILITEEDIYV